MEDQHDHALSTSDDPRVELARDRTSMANFRTQLAMDRTTLAWVRTTLTMASFGFGMAAFFRSLEADTQNPKNLILHQRAVWMGIALVLLSISATVVASLLHWQALRKLRQGEPPVLSQWPLSITIALLSGVIGLLGLLVLVLRG